MNTHTIHRILALIIITAGIVGGSPELLAQNSSASAPAVGRALVFETFGNTGPEYVLQNDSTHQTGSWFQDNNFHAYGPTIPAGWELKAVDYFPFPDDGLYYPSHVLFNPNTRRTAIWYFWQVNGADPRLIGKVDGPTLPSGWELVATGDFTPGWGGQTDYLLYDPRTRQTAVWYLNYTASTPNQTGKIIFTRAADGPTLPADWSLIGVADFDGDGSTDYALFNPITRQTAIWYLNGTTVIGNADGPTLPPGWALVATADFNGDDYTDLLLYNASSRQTRILYLNVNIVVGSAYGPTIPSGWSLTTAPAATLGNISTRSFVQTGDNLMIGGLIVQGTEPKRVILRAIGPELSQYGVPNAMANPTLELHNASGALIASNDDWQHTTTGGIITSDQVQAIQSSGHAPGDQRESAIIANLPPGNYTAIVRGLQNTTGVALVEAYDLSPSVHSILGNISTRSFVRTNDDVMIGGFIVQGSQPKNVIIRAIGPELSQFGIPDFLANPTLELHNASGALIASNDDWQHTTTGGIITSDQVQAIQSSGHAPGDQRESAIIANLPPGNYTAILRGVNNTTGVALVEVYDLGE